MQPCISDEARTLTSPGDGDSSSEPVGAVCSNRRVLVVDDEDNVRASLQRLLRREPYTLLTARHAEEALALLEKEPVQVVVSDYRMPGMTGTEFLSHVQERYPETIRIVLSGYSEVKAIIDAINRGAIYKFVSKPWNDEELRLHIRRAMEQYELKSENSRMAREIALQNSHLQELNSRLDQQAQDASAGQNIAQSVLEATAAGVMVVDVDGLIVLANGQAHELFDNPPGGLIGVAADSILGEIVGPGATASGRAPDPHHTGTVRVGERMVSYATRSFMDGDRHVGYVITLWSKSRE